MNWRHFLGVFVGVVFSFFLTLVLGMVWGVVMLIYYTSKGLTLRQASVQLDAAHLCNSILCLIATIGLGAFAMLLGGLLAGWIGRSGQELTGLATGILSTVISIPFFFWYPYPLWYDVVAVVFTIGPAAMGGYLARVFANVRRVPLPAAS